MAGQEEIIQPDNMAEVWQNVTKPGDQPTEGKYGSHLRPEIQPQIDTGSWHRIIISTLYQQIDMILWTRPSSAALPTTIGK